MSRSVTLVVFLLLMLAGMFSTSTADDSFVFEAPPEEVEYASNRFIVQFKNYAVNTDVKLMSGQDISLGHNSLNNLASKYEVSTVRQLFRDLPVEKMADPDMQNYYVVEIGENETVLEAIREFGKNEYVVTAYPVYRYVLHDMPNDSYFDDQWWLYTTEDTNDIDADQCWDYQAGNNSVVVAVIDTGVRYDHPDLMDVIWQNLGEDANGNGWTIKNGVYDPGDLNGLDDDGNGRADDLIGYDYVHATTNPCSGEDGLTPDNDPIDFAGHGTNIAGIIAAETNNGFGVSGIAGGFNGKGNFSGVRIMALRCGYLTSNCSDGAIDSDAAVSAVSYAIVKGADVINISFGPQYPGYCNPGYGLDPAMRSALISAISNDIVVTVAGGNDAVDCPDYLNLITGVINVGATNYYNNRAYFSSYGDWMDISAAGMDMMTTDVVQGVIGYDSYQGTSYSAPVVAAVAALLRSHDPALSNDSIKSILLNTADPLSNPDLGAGKVNAWSALSSQPIAFFTSSSDLSGFSPLPVSFTDQSPTASISSWNWLFGDGDASPDQNPTHNYTDPGVYDVSLTINSPIGAHTYTYPDMVYVTADTMWADKVSEMSVGDTAEVYFHLNNLHQKVSGIKVSIEYGGDASLTLLNDEIFVDGTRCDGWEKTQLSGGGLNKRRFFLEPDTDGDGYPGPLDLGSGPIFYAKFVVGSTGTSNINMSADGYFELWGETHVYQSYYNNGLVTTEGPCQGTCGDPNGDGTTDVSDAVYLINYAFGGGTAPQPVVACGDANSDAAVDVSDAVFIINFAFSGGTAPGDCASGSPAWSGQDCCEFEF